MEVTAATQLHWDGFTVQPSLQFADLFRDSPWFKGVGAVRMRRTHNMGNPVRCGGPRHGDRGFHARRTIVHAPQKVMVNINHCVARLPPAYRAAASDSAIAWNSNRPSTDPRSASLDRS